MNDIIGLLALCLAFVATLGLCARAPHLRNLLLAAFMVRALAALVHHYIVPLPDSGADATSFERTAWTIAESIRAGEGIPDFGASFHYSFFFGLIYSVVGRSSLMMQAGSVFTGTLCIYLSSVLIREVWRSKGEGAPLWVLAFFPTAILYSALTMREMYFAACLLAGMIFVARWIRCNRMRDLALAVAVLMLGVLIHGGMVAALASLFILVFGRAVLALARGLLRGNISVFGLFVMAGSIALALGILWVDPYLPKIGRMSEALQLDPYLRILENRVRGTAAYSEIIIAESWGDIFSVSMLRMIYLLYSPMIWDIKDLSHIIGLFDSALYFMITIFIAKNMKSVIKNRQASAVFFVLLSLVAAFGIGTGNFGAALRHRVKLLFVLMVMAYPAMSRALSRLKWR